MELFIYTHALRDFLRLKRIVTWVLVCGAIGLIGIAWPEIVRRGNLPEQYGQVSSMLTFHMIALASAILTTSIVGQEVEQKTIVYLLTRPVSRGMLLLMRYLAAATTVTIIGAFAAIVLSAIMFGGNPFANELLKNDLLAILFGSFSYSGLFLLISLLITKSMLVCIIFAFGWEVVVPNLPGDLYHLSIFSYMQAIAQHPSTDAQRGTALLSGELGNNLITTSTAYPTLFITTVVVVMVSLWWFTKFEYVPKEEAS